VPAIFHINPSTTFSYSSFVDIPVFPMYDESKMVVSCAWVAADKAIVQWGGFD